MGNLSNVKKPDAIMALQAFVTGKEIVPEKNPPIYSRPTVQQSFLTYFKYEQQ